MNVYDSIIEAVEKAGLTVEERGQMYTAMIEYLYWGREPQFAMKKAVVFCFESMRPVFDTQRAQSARAKKPRPSRRKANGQPNASRTLAETHPDDSQEPTESHPNASEQEQEQDIKKVLPNGSTKEKSIRFTPPTAEEVDAYLAEKGLGAYLTGAEFVGYYGSQGWKKANKQPITNWKLAASGWATREQRKVNPPRKEVLSHGLYSDSY